MAYNSGLATVLLPNVTTVQGVFEARITSAVDSQVDRSGNPIEVLRTCGVCAPSNMNPATFHISNFEIKRSSSSTTNLTSNRSTFMPASTTGSGFVDYIGSTATVVPVPNLMKSPSTSTLNYFIRITVAGSFFSNKAVAIWGDWNNDCIFQTTEMITSFTPGTGSVFQANFSIPSTVSTGLKRLRIRLVGGLGRKIYNSEACSVSFYAGSPNNGETEDYMINVIPYAPSGSGTRIAIESEEEILPSESPSFRIIPNPAQVGGKTRIFLEHLSDSEATLMVTDLFGRKLFWKELDTDGLNEETIVEMELPKGVFMVRLKTGNQVLSDRIVVQ